MKKQFSTKWNSSKNVAKQRKYKANAPLHIKQSFVSAHLSKDLRKKYGRRSLILRAGDKVKVMRGQYKGSENKVERVDLKNTRVYVTGVERAKKDGSKSLIPVNPSNLLLTDLNLEDKRRKLKLEGKSKVSPAPKAGDKPKKAAEKPAKKG